MIIPDCTLTTGCFDLTSYHSLTRSLDDSIKNMSTLLEVPCYLVIFTDSSCFPKIKSMRDSFGLGTLTHYIVLELPAFPHYSLLDQIRKNREIYWPTRDERTCAESHFICCSKFDFVLQTMDINPFSTTRFGWIDANVGVGFSKICENYKNHILLEILNHVDEKFRLQILNVCDKKFLLPENKHEYYNQYRWVVCGCLFITGKEIGQKILHRLNRCFEETTQMGYGHGEEMLYLEVLEEFPQDLSKSYGDYSHILNNFIRPSVGYNYIYELIIRRYLSMQYYRECYEACLVLLEPMEKAQVEIDYSFSFLLLYCLYVSSFYYCREESDKILTRIRDLIRLNPQARAKYESNSEFYNQQFGFCK